MKNNKTTLFYRILALILAGLMVVGIATYTLYALAGLM